MTPRDRPLLDATGDGRASLCGRLVVDVLGTLLSIVFSGFLIGALARLALPGPDPMPFWLTVLLGVSGSIVGGGIATAAYGTGHVFDIQRMRARIRRLGVDPDRLTKRRKNASSNLRPEEQADELEKLRDLHDKGVLSDEEYEKARKRLRRY